MTHPSNALALAGKGADLIAFGGLAILIDRVCPASPLQIVAGLILALVLSALCTIARYPSDFSHREPSHD